MSKMFMARLTDHRSNWQPARSADRPHRGYRGKPSSRNNSAIRETTQWQDEARAQKEAAHRREVRQTRARKGL
jgi:hypothetical protein